jgi:hypothetical protein
LLWGPTRRRAEHFWKYGVSRSLEMAFSESFIPYTQTFWQLLFRYTKPYCWIPTSTRLPQWCEFFQKKKVLCNLTQMKSSLIVKMWNKANIIKNQLGYFRNPWDIHKLWAHREVLVKYVMLMVDPWELATMPYRPLCTCIIIYIFFTIYWVNGCSNVHVYVEISLIYGVVLEFTTVLLLPIFIGRFYGTTGHAGQVFMFPKKFCPPLFMHKNIWPPSFSTSPSPVINDRSLCL